MKEEGCYLAGVEFTKEMNCKEIKDINFEIMFYNFFKLYIKNLASFTCSLL